MAYSAKTRLPGVPRNRNPKGVKNKVSPQNQKDNIPNSSSLAQLLEEKPIPLKILILQEEEEHNKGILILQEEEECSNIEAILILQEEEECNKEILILQEEEECSNIEAILILQEEEECNKEILILQEEEIKDSKGGENSEENIFMKESKVILNDKKNKKLS